MRNKESVTRDVEWSDSRDWKAGNAKVSEAIERSPYHDAFLTVLRTFEAKANQYEQVRVYWWHAPYIYVQVTDKRLKYPHNMRALISFDTTNGRWASWHSERRYVFARRGWQKFLDLLSESAASLYA